MQCPWHTLECSCALLDEGGAHLKQTLCTLRELYSESAKRTKRGSTRKRTNRNPTKETFEE